MNASDEWPEAGWVPELAAAALARIREQDIQVGVGRAVTAEQWAARAERLAQLCEREAGWWSVLGRWVWRQDRQVVPVVLGRAAFEAAQSKSQRAEFWRELAADWRRREAGQPVCALVGCGCSGECGVAAWT